MQLIVPPDPEVASLPRRAAAGAVDTGLGLSAFAAIVALGVVVLERLERADRAPGWWDEDGSSPEFKRWHTVALTLGGGVLGITGRNWRSPGMRLVGTRRVDVHTHGPIPVDSAIVAIGADIVGARLSRALGSRWSKRYGRRRVAANEEIEELRAAHPDADAEELVSASRDVLRRHDVGCGPLAMRALTVTIALRLPALASPRRQTLAERLAGTVVIRER